MYNHISKFEYHNDGMIYEDVAKQLLIAYNRWVRQETGALAPRQIKVFSTQLIGSRGQSMHYKYALRHRRHGNENLPEIPHHQGDEILLSYRACSNLLLLPLINKKINYWVKDITTRREPSCFVFSHVCS